MQWTDEDKIPGFGTYEDIVPYGQYILRVTGQHSGYNFHGNDVRHRVCLHFEVWDKARQMVMFRKMWREDIEAWWITLPGVW